MAINTTTSLYEKRSKYNLYWNIFTTNGSEGSIYPTVVASRFRPVADPRGGGRGVGIYPSPPLRKKSSPYLGVSL